MKLEYIHNGAQDTPLIRLYQFDSKGAIELRRLISDLGGGRRTEVALHAVSWVEPVDRCQLVFHVGVRDEGVVRVGDGFSCVLTSDSWRTVADRIQPFCEKADPNTFQYLDDTSDITLLLSVDGGW